MKLHEDRDECSRDRSSKPPSPALYLSLTAAVSLLIAAFTGSACALALPRHPSAAVWVMPALAGLICAWGAWIAIEALSLRRPTDLLGAVPASLRRAIFGTLYPLCRLAGRIAGFSADAVAASFIALSNGLSARAAGRGIRGRLLVLLPRCLQREGCARAVTEDVRNCARCGKCDLAALVPLMERYGFLMAVATGGRLARAMIRDLKPAGVIAVACERELLEGLREAGGIPVICIANLRPEGPCRNTAVDIGEFEEAVRGLTDKKR